MKTTLIPVPALTAVAQAKRQVRAVQLRALAGGIARAAGITAGMPVDAALAAASAREAAHEKAMREFGITPGSSGKPLASRA